MLKQRYAASMRGVVHFRTLRRVRVRVTEVRRWTHYAPHRLQLAAHRCFNIIYGVRHRRVRIINVYNRHVVVVVIRHLALRRVRVRVTEVRKWTRAADA